mmetsp:Transcript_201/g.640  ORF Transcript_201/g.640 Transcript_201/m.640 type:complete len:200 (+) Transcript_201:329-928(+)
MPACLRCSSASVPPSRPSLPRCPSPATWSPCEACRSATIPGDTPSSATFSPRSGSRSPWQPRPRAGATREAMWPARMRPCGRVCGRMRGRRETSAEHRSRAPCRRARRRRRLRHQHVGQRGRRPWPCGPPRPSRLLRMSGWTWGPRERPARRKRRHTRLTNPMAAKAMRPSPPAHPRQSPPTHPPPLVNRMPCRCLSSR